MKLLKKLFATTPDQKKVVKKIRVFLMTKAGITALITFGVALILSSFYLPYWQLTLKAPQYPQGLHLSVYMDHLEGDVSEVNILNHYIGMKSLEEAAKFERRFAWYGLLIFALGAFLIIVVGRKSFKILYIPPILFIIGFIADLFYWLYDAGHSLNPDAPVDIKPFTPIIIGPGKIGQFSTLATFGWGFIVALLGIAIIFYSIAKKKAICQRCKDFQNCRYFCNRPGGWFQKG